MLTFGLSSAYFYLTKTSYPRCIRYGSSNTMAQKAGGWTLPARGHLVMSGDSFGCHVWERGYCAIGLERVEARDVGQHAAMHRTAPQQE